MHKRNLALSAGLMLAFARHVSAQVTVEVVNDSGKDDSAIYLKALGSLISGAPTSPPPITPTNIFLNVGATNITTAGATSVPLTTLATNYSVAPYQTVSAISGRTNTVYTFQADYISSGTVYFTYDKPFVFTNGVQPNPVPNGAFNAYRYDYVELTVDDQTSYNNAVDATYVDKFGIPIQTEWFSGTSTNSSLVAACYIYASTKSLVDRFSEDGLGQAVYAVTSNNITAGWTYTGPDSYTNFARILSPGKVDGTGNSVAPYPSITNYLNSLVGNPFWMNGASPQKGYNYVGYIASLSNTLTGWMLTLVKGTNIPPYDPTLIDGIAYTNTITVPLSFSNVSQYIYGSPVGPNQYYTNGVLVTTNNGATSFVETWMIGDALSSINFGFWHGNYGTNSAFWFTPVEWTALPFAAARPTPDQYFNVYAALIYNYSDPYSYAFSERITPDVIMSPVNGQKLRITILPDDRLDAPVLLTPEGSAITSNSITYTWLPSPGASGYKLNVLRPLNTPSISLSPSTTSYTLTNLQSGTPYVVSVQATGTGAGGNAIITPARPVSVSTPGPSSAVSSNFTLMQMTFNAADPYYQLSKATINGTDLFRNGIGQWLTTNGVNATWMAAAGTNQVVVKVFDTNNVMVYSDWVTFTLAQGFPVSGATNTAISNVFMFGQKLSQVPPGVTIQNGTTNSFPIVSVAPPAFSIGLSYVPAESRKFVPVKPITPPVSGVLITNVAGIPGGGIRFSFNVPQGTNYAIIASTNVAAAQSLWQTNATGVGQAGLTSYTNAAGGNSIQFYRVKY